MLTAARLAFADVISPGFRSVMLKSLALTLLLLVVFWAALEGVLAWAIDIKAHPWLDTLISIVTGVGLLIGLGFVAAPVAALVAGLFSDRIAAMVEFVHYPFDRQGRSLPTSNAIWATISFTGLVIVVNLIALALLLVPGINAIAFLLGNGYLLGREFFEAVVGRHLSAAETRRTRVANRRRVFVGGLVIAAFSAIPILNLATALFATSFMVHLYKRTIRPVPTERTDFAL